MSNAMAIGSTNFSRNRFSNTWHKLDAGDNYYRILPPLFSMAAEGRYSAFWAFHGGFKNSDGVTQMFRCIETKDNKTKLIKQHCPVCDLVTQLQAHYERLQEAQKAGQATDDQVKKFWNEEIFPIKAQKVFFVNAVNREGAVGVLQLPYKAHQAVDDALRSCAERNGIDPTGVDGAWLNIKKVQPFPRSPQVSYGAEVVFEPTGNGSFQIKRHTLDQAFIENQIKTGAKDLKTLFREISPEDVAALASVHRTQRPAIVDRIFGRKEQAAPEANNPLSVQVPGTTAVLQGRVTNTSDGGIAVQMPTAPAPAPTMTPFAAPAQPQPAPFAPAPPPAFPSQFAPPAAAPAFTPPAAPAGNPFAFPGNTAPVAPPVAAPAPVAPPAAAPAPLQMGQTTFGGAPPVATIGADEFRNIFGQKPN